MNEQVFRHEFKYLISTGQIPLLCSRMNGLISVDLHAGTSGSYQVTSLYFDDYYNSCCYENENGTDPREKFRIRIYNHSTQRITLECKRKERGKTLKTACPLSLAQAEEFMQGHYQRNISRQHPLLQKFSLQMMQQGMHPVVIVDYVRTPYIEKHGNVRITIDTNISSSRDIGNFLTGRFSKRPVLPVGMQLLEVKYDTFLPDPIYRAIQLENLNQIAFSKYYLCRKYAERR